MLLALVEDCLPEQAPSPRGTLSVNKKLNRFRKILLPAIMYYINTAAIGTELEKWQERWAGCLK